VASRRVRSFIAVSFGVGISGVLGLPACDKTYSCVGDFSSSSCSVLDASTCTKVHGCSARTPTCLNACDAGNCDSTDCRKVSGGCTSLCPGALAEDECDGLLASLGAGGPSVQECEWSADGADGGAACRSVCNALDDEKACEQQAAAGCTWVECEGTAKGDCSSYSGDDCPTYLGCDRTSAAIASP